MYAGNKLLKNVSKKQCAEFGQAITLAALFFSIYLKNSQFVNAAFVLMLVTVIAPVIFYPFAILWFNLVGFLSVVSPAIMMTILFFLIVTPVALIRRLLGKDSLRLKQFKKDERSVMTDRDNLYTETDLLHTF